MLSQNPAERPVLAPASSSTLNVASHAPGCGSRKRKSDVVEATGSDEPTFTARFLAASEQLLAFSPVTLIARACLPLAWLDTSQALPSPVFSATIPSVQEWEQRVLVVRKLPNGGLYGVEKVGTDTYVACALHNWVSQAWCTDAAIGKVAEAKLEDLLRTEDGASSRRHSRVASSSSFVAALPTPKSPKRPTNRRGALARMSILTPWDMAGDDETAQSSSSPRVFESVGVSSPTKARLPITSAAETRDDSPFGAEHITQAATEPALDLPQEHEQVSDVIAAVQDPCAPERLRNQYFEHLYASKTSLAFYVKGPLSRARAHVRSTGSPSRAISDLSDFYEQSIIPTKKIDTKYKESLSSIIKGLASTDTTGQEGQDAQRKRQKKKKQKLGKDCLWPEEKDYIKKWWTGRDLKATINGTSLPDEMRKELADLRMRETKMQMLLILEVMLLKLAVARLSEAQHIPNDPEVKIESIEDETSAILAKMPQKQKTARKRDLVGELDTIVDRLCIWHTVSLDELGTTTSAVNSSSTAKPSDSLRDFCKDVLLPFYSAKLPEQVKSLSRKLGGPEISPKRPKAVSQLQGRARAPATALTRSSSSSSPTGPDSRPGQPRLLAKRTLERVLSEDQAQRHASPPTTLSRSSTAPLSVNALVPTLKREPSERPLSRGGMGMLAKSASFSNREIDLVADSRAHEAKRRKLDRLAQQKRELEAAIEALRRPSRNTVASAFMDEVEKRGDKTKTVEITATPRARRVGDRPVLPVQIDGQTRSAEPGLPSPTIASRREQVFTVPSSTAKADAHVRPPSGFFGSSGGGGMALSSLSRSSATKRAVLSAIHETPSRGMEGKTSNPLGLSSPAPRLVSSSAARADGTDEAEDPQPSLSSQSCGSSQFRSRRPVLFTTVKKSEVSVEHAFRDVPEIPERAGKMMDRVMGGKARAFPAGFGDASGEPDGSSSTCLREPRVASAEVLSASITLKNGGGHVAHDEDQDGDIYAKLGWNDDDFDI